MTALTFLAASWFVLCRAPPRIADPLPRSCFPSPRASPPTLPVGMWVLIEYIFFLERPSSDDDFMCSYLYYSSIVM